jgi:hypothetical protein
MSFAQASQVILRIAAPIANICDDDELADTLKDFMAMRTAPVLKSYGTTVPKLLSYCLGKHRLDTYEIIEALLDIPKAEIDKANFVQIVNGLQDSWDEVLAGFFTRSKPAAKKSARAS